MRRRAKVDANQQEVVKALRDAGASVLHLHQLGHGAPDLLVGFRGCNVLMEIKDPTKKPSERELTDDEKKFFGTWEGQVMLVYTAEQAVNFLEEHC